MSEVSYLGTTEKELQVLRTQAVHSDLVVVDGASNHSCLLLLQGHHTRLDTVLNTEACNDARSLLTNTMAAVSRLPLGSWIPPTTIVLAKAIRI